MHPIFRAGKLALYLLAWWPPAGALVLLLATEGRLSWTASGAMALPLCLLYAFVCLSSWYVCRALPLGRERLPRILFAQSLSAILVAGAWTGLAFAILRSAGSPGPVAPALATVFSMGLVLYLLSVAVHYVLLAVDASRMAEARAAQARLLAGEAELRALKAQINPHFLFNSLHSISALTSIDAARAREMCITLAGFLRSTLGLGDRAVIPFEEELALARNYVAIEKVRFGARLELREEVAPDCARYSVPPLLLQPLVENALVHGIAQLVEPGLLRITAEAREGELRILVENSVDAEMPPRPPGFGLASVRKRLHARYGDEASLETGAAGGVFRARVRLPAEEPPA